MKILIYSYFDDKLRDGASLSTYMLIKHFLQLGHEVTLVTCSEKLSVTNVFADNQSFIHLHFHTRCNQMYEYSKDLLSFIRDRVAEFDVFLLRGLYSVSSIFIAWSYRIRTKLYVNPLGNLPQRRKPPSKSRLKWLLTLLFFRLVVPRLLLKARKIICASDVELHRLHELIPVVDAVVIENGVEAPLPLYGKNPIPSQPYAIFLGRISPEKNLEFLISVWKQQNSTSNLQLHIYGDASNEKYLQLLKSQVYSAGLDQRVLFFGSIHGEEKFQKLRGAEILLLPSLFESFGNVVLEALAVGVPVIASDGLCWSRLDKLSLGNSLPLKEDLWVRQIQYWYRRSDSEKEFSRNNSIKFTAVNYSWYSSADKYIQLFSN